MIIKKIYIKGWMRGDKVYCEDCYFKKYNYSKGDTPILEKDLNGEYLYICDNCKKLLQADGRKKTKGQIRTKKHVWTPRSRKLPNRIEKNGTKQIRNQKDSKQNGKNKKIA